MWFAWFFSFCRLIQLLVISFAHVLLSLCYLAFVYQLHCFLWYNILCSCIVTNSDSTLFLVTSFFLKHRSLVQSANGITEQQIEKSSHDVVISMGQLPWSLSSAA